MKTSIPVAIFISGTGSNLQAAMDELCDGTSRYKLVLVVSQRRKSLGLLKARRAGIPVHVSSPLDWEEINLELRRRQIQVIFLLGFMRLLPETFVTKWRGKIWNLHPSLLPNYPGLQSIERAYKDKAPMGLTIHQVTAQLDSGAILTQIQLRSTDGFDLYNDLQTTEREIHRLEHRIVRKVFQKWNLVAK